MGILRAMRIIVNKHLLSSAASGAGPEWNHEKAEEPLPAAWPGRSHAGGMAVTEGRRFSRRPEKGVESPLFRSDYAMNRSPVLIAALWMLGALMSLIMLAVSARQLAAHMGIFEILFLRSAASLVLVLPLLRRRGLGQLRSLSLGTHLVRNTAHLGAQFAWITGLASLSLAEVFALEFTGPIWAALIAAFLLGERLTRFRVLSLAMGMIGVLVMVRPGFNEIHPAIFVVLASAVLFALANVLTKKLVVRDSPLSIIFWMTAMHLVMSAAPAALNWTPPTLADLPWVLAMAVVSITAHFCLSKAFAQADAMVVAPLDFLRLPLAAVVGWVLYQEGLDWFVMLGALVMFTGNLVNLWAERRRVRPLMAAAATEA